MTSMIVLSRPVLVYVYCHLVDLTEKDVIKLGGWVGQKINGSPSRLLSGTRRLSRRPCSESGEERRLKKTNCVHTLLRRSSSDTGCIECAIASETKQCATDAVLS